MVSQEFESAYAEAGNLKNASQDDMLQVSSSTLLDNTITNEMKKLYALAKIARGEDISKVSKPGMFDLKVGTLLPVFPTLVEMIMCLTIKHIHNHNEYVSSFQSQLLITRYRAKPSTISGKNSSIRISRRRMQRSSTLLRSGN